MSNTNRPPTPSDAIQWTCLYSNINNIKSNSCSKCSKVIGCTYQDSYGNILTGGNLKILKLYFSQVFNI